MLGDLRSTDPESSILNLKGLYHGTKYVAEAIEMLPSKSEPHLLTRNCNKLAALGRIYVGQPTLSAP
jgi:hypothetical protein